MILGFLGKGGSGKSTVATQMALWLHDQGKEVLAIDADHNMDLVFNLTSGNPSRVQPFGDSLSDLYRYLNLPTNATYRDIFFDEQLQRPLRVGESEYLTTYTHKHEPRMSLMAAGPQTDAVLYGKSCSHVLTTPLKVVLPLLNLSANQVVVVDEKAGADGVTTGIVTGIDVGVIVVEPAVHSLKTGKQIAELLAFYETPHVFVANKIQDADDIAFVSQQLQGEPVAVLGAAKAVQRSPDTLSADWADQLRVVAEAAQSQNRSDRLMRTREKFRRNREFFAE